MECVCTTWTSACSEPSLWRVINLNFGMHHFHANTICRRAVDLSQGQLVDFSINRFRSDDLLQYVSDRCSNLKRLYLGSDCDISPKVLMSALKNFSRLEEFHLYFKPILRSYKFDLEAIGIACPLLKSFSFIKLCSYSNLKVNNRDALAVVKYMPNLCRLGLTCNGFNNNGLQAIFDGFPNLEALDIRLCYNVDIESDLWRRCLERIKELRFSKPKVTLDRQYNYDSDYYIVEDDDCCNDDNGDDCVSSFN